MNDDKYKMNVDEQESEVKERNKISKFQLSNIIIACAMGLNYIFLIDDLLFLSYSLSTPSAPPPPRYLQTTAHPV